MRYYTRVSNFILPTIQGRPLVLKRFPNGINGESFYQQKPAETSSRFSTLSSSALSPSTHGIRAFNRWSTLTTRSSIWIRARARQLCPGHSGCRWAKEVTDGFGLNAAIKTSGSTGLHIYLPLPPSTSNETARLVAQMIATNIADAHPKEATIERFVKARGAATGYLDYLQNIQGKTVAGAYSVRAKPGATVSTPLKWNEVADDLDPRAFHLGNAAERFERVGDVWAEAMGKKNSLRALV